MISILQNCKRCQAQILYSKVNKEKGIYHCNNCDVVSSIYDERVYRQTTTKVPKPSDLRLSIEENEIHIELPNSKMRLPNFKRAGCVVLPIAWIILGFVFNFSMTVNGVSQGWKLKSMALTFSICITIFIIWRMHLQRERKLFIQLDPFNLTIYQYKNEQKIILESVPSYMIDQLSAKNLSMGDLQLFSLNLLTKDHKMKEILRGKKEYLPHFKFIESTVESYLGLRDRKVSGEA